MCLIVFAWRAHPRFPLVVAANRDEFYGRPTAPAAFWDDRPELLAGRDLSAGGTWLGVTRGGRFAAVTNVREPGRPPPEGAWSRGRLVAGFLAGDGSTAAYLDRVSGDADRFAGFNLLAGDGDTLGWLSNRGDGARLLEPGVYGVSNALLDTPWPKVELGKADLRSVIASSAAGSATDEEMEARLFASLARRDPAPDARLPATGVGTEFERALSSAFIATPGYGTRSSTVLTVDIDGRVSFTERTVEPGTGEFVEARYGFSIEGSRSETGSGPVVG